MHVVLVLMIILSIKPISEHKQRTESDNTLLTVNTRWVAGVSTVCTLTSIINHKISLCSILMWRLIAAVIDCIMPKESNYK